MRYSFFHWLAGYDRYLIEKYGSDQIKGADDPSLAKLKAIGMSLGLACILVPVGWAIGSWSWTIGQDSNVRIAVSLFAALFGLLIILTIDRSVIFSMDVARDDTKVRGYLILRMLMVVGIGLFTTEQIVPYIMRADLTLQAVKNGKDSRSLDAANDSKAANISGWKESFDTATASEASAILTLQTNNDIVNEKRRSLTACRKNNNNLRVACASQRSAVANAVKLRDESSVFLDETVKNRKAAGEDLRQAYIRLDKLTELSRSRADKVETFSAISTTELIRLMSQNLEVRLKVLVILFILMMIETMPILTKMMVGNTNIGYAISLDDETRSQQLKRNQTDEISNFSISHLIRDIYIDAIHSKESRQKTLDEVQVEVPTFLKSHIVMRMHDDINTRLKSTSRNQLDDQENYGPGEGLSDELFMKLLDKVKNYWKRDFRDV